MDSAPPHDLDKVIYATIARMTSGLSPASLFNAYVYWVRWLSDKSSMNTDNFRPGHEVAITPGKVVYRNHLIELIQYTAQTPRKWISPSPLNSPCSLMTAS